MDGLTVAQAWPGRASAVMGGVPVPVLGLADLRTNKLAAGRPKDLLDLALLDERMSVPGTGRQNSE